MELSKIIGRYKVKIIGDISGIEVKKLACDTKFVESGTLFFCLKGTVVDGHSFAQTAADSGAVLLVVEHPLDVDLPQLVVENSREAMSVMAGNFFDNPKDKLKLIGVTGTNGKTTSTYMLASILRSAGFKVGIIGTLGVIIDQITLPAKLTTPDPIELHQTFAQMVQNGVNFVVMEVSAHAIALNKMSGIVCDVGILTNITQDHIDFFKTFDNYASTKLSFIDSKFCRVGVVNVDDENCARLITQPIANKSPFPIFSFGLNNPANVFATRQKFRLNGTQFFLNLFDEVFEVNAKFIGQFNLYNALGVATACRVMGVEIKDIIHGLEEMEEVAGRFNVLDLGEGRSAVLDYAHTPDGLLNILTSVRQISNGKIVSVFGCGGNRDALKRPIMGKISASVADFTIITSDNPRLETPSEIISQVEQGLKNITENYLCVENRVEAIRYALSMLSSGDVMVVSGKGAENYLDIGGVKYPYSDLETILQENQKFLKERKLR